MASPNIPCLPQHFEIPARRGIPEQTVRYLLVHFQHQSELSRNEMIAHRGLDKMDKAPEEQMHVLFRFDSLNVITPLQTRPWHTLSYSVYSYHPKSTGNKIKYFIRLLFGCYATGTKCSPLPQTSCREM